ncbi:hypothetical protein MMC14_005962 [Varicellaria rhodocarpa]|nr:hypothetical protein [Varicellaria rhodocarpa]
MFGALSGPILTTNTSPNVIRTISRLPMIVLWIWINLLPFAIDNQRQSKAIQEDSENKPWRSMPSKRLSQSQARSLMLTFYLAAWLTSFFVGGSAQCVLLMLLGYWYNDLEGADRSCVVRNFINACGFLCYASAATEIAAGYPDVSLNGSAWKWYCIIGFIVFTTVQSQDLYDQPGDRLRGRNTVPLVLGDYLARWTIAIPVALWSGVCPMFWELGLAGYMAPTFIGTIVVFRTLSKRTIEADKLTFKIWNLWMVILYLLPLNRRFVSA